ncbi:hypothetical protein HKCCE2091_14485 [Rhodobacterales bacterium HKCCE2091]|nr:hypothetical protein [Rhodobacterales bacterium HKCCE2091]
MSEAFAKACALAWEAFAPPSARAIWPLLLPPALRLLPGPFTRLELLPPALAWSGGPPRLSLPPCPPPLPPPLPPPFPPPLPPPLPPPFPPPFPPRSATAASV